MSFDGFSRETLEFLRRLGRNNTRDWFESNRDVYEREIVARAKQFVVAMAPKLFALSPEIVAEPRIDSSIRRIYRDTRFSRDKTPYKDYLDFFFRYEGAPKDGPGYFMRIKADAWLVGAGAASFDRDQLKSYREAVAADTGVALERIVSRLRTAGYTTMGEHYKRLPRGYEADGLRADLLRHAALHGHIIIDDTSALLSSSVLTTAMSHFRKLSPLAEWLAAHVRGDDTA